MSDSRMDIICNDMMWDYMWGVVQRPIWESMDGSFTDFWASIDDTASSVSLHSIRDSILESILWGSSHE